MCVALFLAGCAAHDVNPAPSPLVSPPTAYTMPTGTALSAGPWYAAFGVPDLTRLIDASLQSNFDVRGAMARLRQAGFETEAAGAARLPELGAEASARVTKEDSADRETTRSAGLALDWELDAFGRLGAIAGARKLEESAAAADVEAVRLSLAAEIAEAWFSAVAQNVQLRLLRQQSSTDAQLLDLVNQRMNAGVGTNVEVLQQTSQLAENDSLIPPAEANLRVFENRLDVLSGNAPDAANRTSPDADFSAIGGVPALGVPSDLLLNRPDLRAARDRLVAQDKEIAAAIADRLPRITLTGSHVYAAGAGAAADIATTALASIVQPLIDWGRRKAEVERNKALYEERLAAFTQSYLEALEDVENALFQENRQREYIARIEARKKSLSDTLAAAEAVYRQGQSDYLPVLNAVKDLRAVERDLITQRLNLVLYRIRLYRALGGQPVVSSPEGA